MAALMSYLTKFVHRLALMALIFAPCAAMAQVSAESTQQLRPLAMVDLPGMPGFDEVVFANGSLVLTHSSANTVDIIDPVKRRMVAQIKNVDQPRGLAVDAAGGLLYVAAAGNNTIDVVSTADWKVVGVLGLRNSPGRIVYVPQMKSLLVASPMGRTVSVVSTESAQKIAPTAMSELASFEVQGSPQDMAWDAEEKVAYVTLEDTNEVITLNPSLPDNPISRRTKLAASQPTAILFEPNTRRLFVAVRYAVLQLDANNGTETARVAAAPGTDSLWLDQSTNNLFAAAGDGTVTVISANEHKLALRGEYKGDVRGHALAYDPANHLIFLTGGREGKSKMLVLRNISGIPAVESVNAKN
jgi:DNA-binding beta-propeller fold protein YncE